MNLEELEKRLNEISDQFERRFDEIAKRIEERFSQPKSPDQPQPDRSHPARSARNTPFWGIALIVVGVILLNHHFDWFELDIPILPAILIILGLYLIFEDHHR